MIGQSVFNLKIKEEAFQQELYGRLKEIYRLISHACCLIVSSMIVICLCVSLVTGKSLLDPMFLRLCMMFTIVSASIMIKQVDIHSMGKSMYLLLLAVQLSVYEDCLAGPQFTRLLAMGYIHLISCMFQRFSIHDRFTKVAVNLVMIVY